MMVTILSASTSGIVSAFAKPLVMQTFSKTNRYDVGALSNGILAGLVAITGVCDRCEPWASVAIGAIGGIVYVLACRFSAKIGVDDPVEASQVHGFCGIWGLIAVGIFDNEKGLMSSSPESWSYLVWQIVGMIIILAWATVISVLYFLLMRKFKMLRVSLLEEVIGLDAAEMGEKALVISRINEQIIKSQALEQIEEAALD